jgi:hypothetical protein
MNFAVSHSRSSLARMSSTASAWRFSSLPMLMILEERGREP